MRRSTRRRLPEPSKQSSCATSLSRPLWIWRRPSKPAPPLLHEDWETYEALGIRTHFALVTAAVGGPYGSKGITEAPNVPTSAAISNAIAKLIGRPARQLPMTAERVWCAMEEEGSRSSCRRRQSNRCSKRRRMVRRPSQAEPNEEEIRIGLSGNLCRCTGCTGILAAVVRTVSEV